jgi:tetratricopeptide (TPR) repeat protein
MIEKINEWDRQISFSIAVLTVFAALLGYLQMTASNLNSQYRAESSRYAVEAMRLRSTGEARASFEAGHVLRLTELIAQQKALAESREDVGTVEKLDVVADALTRLSPVLREPYAALGDDALARYESDAYVVDSVHAEQMRAAVTELDMAWDTKANTYVVHLTLIAIVLALLGLSQAMADIPRVMVLVVSAVLTIVTFGWSASTYAQPLPVLAPNAIDAFATAYGAAYQNKQEDALKGYDDALKQLPTYASAHYERGLTLYALGRNEESLQSLAAARQYEYDAASVDAMESYLLMVLGRHADAEASAQRWVAREPESRDALGALLVAQAARDQLDAASATAKKLQESSAAAIAKQRADGAGVDDMIINELDVTADLLNDVLLASQGEEGIEITNVKLSDATAAGVRDIKHALVSQAMSAAFDTDGTSKGTVSAIEFGTLGENGEFVAAKAIDQNEKAVALQLTTDGIAVGTHILVRFYEDGFENQALRYVGEWDGEPTGTTMLVVPADLGEGYVLTPGAYQIELYVNGVLQLDRVPFEVEE